MSTHAADHWRKENKDMNEERLQDHDISESLGSTRGITTCWRRMHARASTRHGLNQTLEVIRLKPRPVATGCVKIGSSLEKTGGIPRSDTSAGHDAHGRTIERLAMEHAQSDALADFCQTTLERLSRTLPAMRTGGENALDTTLRGDSNRRIPILVEIECTMQRDREPEGTGEIRKFPRRVRIKMIRMVDEPDHHAMGARHR